MKVSATMLLLFVLTGSAIASLQDDLGNENLSMINVFQRALLAGVPVKEVVTQAIQNNRQRSSSILGAAIAVSPGSIADIIESAAKLATEPEVIAAQCRAALTSEEVGRIIVSSLRYVKRPEPILTTCLAMIPREEVALYVVQALAAAGEDLHARIISAAFDAVVDDDGSNVTLLASELVESVAQQEFNTVITEGDIVELSAFATPADAGVSADTEAATLIDLQPEPPASES